MLSFTTQQMALNTTIKMLHQHCMLSIVLLTVTVMSVMAPLGPPSPIF
jgi:hypothetical protein